MLAPIPTLKEMYLKKKKCPEVSSGMVGIAGTISAITTLFCETAAT